MYSIFDNGKGNKIEMSQAQRYAENVPIIKGLIRKLKIKYDVNDGNNKFTDTPSCQWVIQMALQTCRDEDPSGKRLFFMDFFMEDTKFLLLLII